MGNMKELKFFHAGSNQITSIPSEIAGMQNLEDFVLSDNQIGSIPSEIGMLYLRNFRMDSNLITSIPSEIGSLGFLYEINLSGNQIQSIPSQIGLMGRLTKIWIAHNSITSIPSEIASIQSLREINLSGNQIRSIPTEIGSMQYLINFWIENNLITSVPIEIASMASLQNFVYEDDDTCEVDVEFTMDCAQSGFLFNIACESPLQIVTFRYNGGNCSQTDGFIFSDFASACEDSNRGPPTDVGAPSFIIAESLGDDDRSVYFAGQVAVGETFTLNANKVFDRLSDVVIIRILRSQGGTVLQSLIFDASCLVTSSEGTFEGNLFPFVRIGENFGATTAIEFTEASGKVVQSMRKKVALIEDVAIGHDGKLRGTFDITMKITSRCDRPVILNDMIVIINLQEDPIDNYKSRIHGKRLEPGAMLELPGYPITFPEKKAEYVFLVSLLYDSIIYEGSSGDFAECSLGWDTYGWDDL